jgi:hypothetical protein
MPSLSQQRHGPGDHLEIAVDVAKRSFSSVTLALQILLCCSPLAWQYRSQDLLASHKPQERVEHARYHVENVVQARHHD